MSTAGSRAGEITAAFAWLPGYEYAGDLTELIECWPHLPFVGQGGRPEQCAGACLNELKGLTGPGGGPLVMGSARAAGGTWLAGLRELRWDSNFFGFEIGSLCLLMSPDAASINDADISAGKNVVRACVRLAGAKDLQQLSASIDSSDTLAQLALQMNGFRLMDSLVFFELRLEHFSNIEPDQNIHAMDASEVEPTAAISAECFGSRRHNINRFNSDPQFPQHRVCELYAQSVRSSYARKIADQVLVYEQDGSPVGFITLSLPGKREQELGVNCGKIPLNAVHPDYQGRGIYRRLVLAALNWFRAQGVDSVEISTQLPNVAVHKTWEKLGAHLVRSCHRFHLNLKAT